MYRFKLSLYDCATYSMKKTPYVLSASFPYNHVFNRESVALLCYGLWFKKSAIFFYLREMALSFFWYKNMYNGIWFAFVEDLVTPETLFFSFIICTISQEDNLQKPA